MRRRIYMFLLILEQITEIREEEITDEYSGFSAAIRPKWEMNRQRMSLFINLVQIAETPSSSFQYNPGSDQIQGEPRKLKSFFIAINNSQCSLHNLLYIYTVAYTTGDLTKRIYSYTVSVSRPTLSRKIPITTSFMFTSMYTLFEKR